MLVLMISTFGRWTKCTSNSMAQGAECGFLPNVKIPFCFTIPHVKVSATLVPYVCAMASWLINGSPKLLMLTPFGPL